jgi:hypothetical protein
MVWVHSSRRGIDRGRNEDQETVRKHDSYLCRDFFDDACVRRISYCSVRISYRSLLLVKFSCLVSCFHR